jgi:hypothetical protein
MAEEFNLQKIHSICKEHTEDHFKRWIELYPQFMSEIKRLEIYVKNEVFKMYTGKRLIYILGDGSETHSIKELTAGFEGHEDSNLRLVSFELDEFGTGYALFESPEVEFEGGDIISNWHFDRMKREGKDYKLDYMEDQLHDWFRFNCFFEVDKTIIYLWYATQFDLPDGGIWGKSIDSLKSILLDIKTTEELELEIKRILKEE